LEEFLFLQGVRGKKRTATLGSRDENLPKGSNVSRDVDVLVHKRAKSSQSVVNNQQVASDTDSETSTSLQSKSQLVLHLNLQSLFFKKKSKIMLYLSDAVLKTGLSLKTIFLRSLSWPKWSLS